MDRLKKAAKGKGSSNVKPGASGAHRSEKDNESSETDGKTGAKVTKDSQTRPSIADPHTSQSTPSKRTTNTAPVKSTVASAPMSKATCVSDRRDVEYTDSSDDTRSDKGIGSSKSKDQTTLHVTKSAASKENTSAATNDPKRNRHGVGNGAGTQSEPWLDVKTRGDWDRLLARFLKVNAEYEEGVKKVQKEREEMEAELQMAKAFLADGLKPGGVYNRDDVEEGEAYPEINVGGVNVVVAPLASVDENKYNATMKMSWRMARKDRVNGAALASRPFTTEELSQLIDRMRDLEAQLMKMQNVLTSSKIRLMAQAGAR